MNSTFSEILVYLSGISFIIMKNLDEYGWLKNKKTDQIQEKNNFRTKWLIFSGVCLILMAIPLINLISYNNEKNEIKKCIVSFLLSDSGPLLKTQEEIIQHTSLYEFDSNKSRSVLVEMMRNGELNTEPNTMKCEKYNNKDYTINLFTLNSILTKSKGSLSNDNKH